jgi:dTDP-4-amino-4,6-dideoxygalactose transaminase
VYVDSEEDGYNIDLSQVKSYITNKTAALVITAMYGYPINTSLLNNIRQSYPDLVIIGDNCLSLFTSIPDPDYANQFDFSFYSFGLGKQMSTIEGGMLLTNRDDLFELVQSMQSKLGFKASFRTKFMRIAALISASIMFSTPFYKILYFLSEKTTVLQSIKGSHVAVTELLPDDVLTSPANFQAALGLSQLTKKDENSRRRLKIVETYFHSFRGHEQQRFELPPYYPYLSHFPILVDKRDALQRHLLAQGIHTTNVFREMPSDLPLLQEYCHGSYSRAQFITDHCLLLPLFPHLSKRHLYRVIHAVLEWDGS